MKKLILLFFLYILLNTIQAQLKENTQIRGFMDINSVINTETGELSFGLGEQDLFITSDITDKISFLGESVFKFSSTSSSKFAASIERAVISYNFKGNHSIVAGKFHTALNYWNDSYHHGRLFFPTVGRPELFNQKIIPIHTTGVGIQGENLTKLKFGYNFMVGNGLSSTDVRDNNKAKSVTAAVHIKPIEGLRLGLSSYFDNINTDSTTIQQQLFSGSIAYFKGKYEFLAEGTYGLNSTDSISSQATIGTYVYVGYRIKDVIVPYFRFDFLQFDEEEMYFAHNQANVYTGGIRYEISYLAVLKLEYQHKRTELAENTNKIFLQFAIGF